MGAYRHLYQRADGGVFNAKCADLCITCFWSVHYRLPIFQGCGQRPCRPFGAASGVETPSPGGGGGGHSRRHPDCVEFPRCGKKLEQLSAEMRLMLQVIKQLARFCDFTAAIVPFHNCKTQDGFFVFVHNCCFHIVLLSCFIVL